jgi:hypothetical protein
VLLELKIDTVKYYVDPTYPKEPFNRLRWYYQDVKALPIDEEVFDFIRLPLDDTGNYLRFDVQAEIDDAGNLSASGCAKLTGEYCFRYRDTFKQIDSVKFKELLIDNFFTQFKAEEILSPSIDTSVCNDTCIGINFNLKKAQYAEKIEDELIFPAYFVDPIKRDLFPEDTSRSNSIQFSFPYTSISSVQLQLPPDYIYDANPLKLDYNRLGESLRYLMNISSSEEQDIIFIIRNLRRKIVVASKEDYPAIRDFYQKSALNDNYKIVIHK